MGTVSTRRRGPSGSRTAGGLAGVLAWLLVCLSTWLGMGQGALAAAPAATPEPVAAAPVGPTPSESKGPAEPATEPAAEPRHNIRLQYRTGLYGSDYGLYTGDTSLQGTYFSGGKTYFAFFNFESVFVDRRFSHIESELNLTGNPFHARPWLAPISFTARGTTDWTPWKTLGVGPSVNLTNFPFMAFAKRAWFDLYFQYYPLKTDDHLGEQDFMFYWRVPIWKRKVYIRGFARLFIFHREGDRGLRTLSMYGNDLIVELRKGIDIYFRHAELVGPRRSGFSVGIRTLLRF